MWHVEVLFRVLTRRVIMCAQYAQNNRDHSATGHLALLFDSGNVINVSHPGEWSRVRRR